jgi:hypothetical protein
MTRNPKRPAALFIRLCLSSPWFAAGALAQDATGHWHGADRAGFLNSPRADTSA